MKSISRLCVLVFAMLLSAGGARAQWSNVAPGLLGANSQYGAMQFRDGIVWAGVSDLWKSKDSGQTWKKVRSFPNDLIMDIAFYDSLTGLVCTYYSAVYLTTDGGVTWSEVLSDGQNEFTKVSFNGSAKTMHALIFDGLLFSSVDGGANWTTSSAGGNSGDTRSIAVANDRTVYVISSDGSSGNYLGTADISSDLGNSWSAGGQAVAGDCYTLSVDSCDSKRLYLVNEQVNFHTDYVAKLYLSSDAGATWQQTASHNVGVAPYEYYSGTITTTKYGVFAGTKSSDGILRSMDRGLTWKAIGGPAVTVDSRLIAAIDDNIILAADSSGSIWLTKNSGGDSIPAHAPGVVAFSSTTLFAGDTLQCDSIQRTLQITRTCFAPYPGAASIVGADSASFSIVSSNDDSVSVVMLPNATGVLDASLIVNLSDATQDTIPIHGFSAAAPYKYTFVPNTLFSSDTIQCDSMAGMVTINRAGCFGAFPKQISIGGRDSASFQILSISNDSVSVILLPNSTGALNASLILGLSDGTKDSLPLLGYCKTPIWHYSYTPANLFNTDSLLSCDPPVVDTILINAAACQFPTVKSENISGVNSNDYTLTQSINQPFSDYDTVIIQFAPSDSGARAGVYEVLLSNGDTIFVPLGGYRYSPRQLALATNDVKTDTIGGTVKVPIGIGGLIRTENINIVMHYDTRLEYENSFDMSGAQVDIPGQQWAGRSELHLPNAMPGTIQGYSIFNVWSDTTGQPLVTYDSVAVLSELAPCEYILPPPDTSIVTPIVGCSVELLSKLVHLGESPRFDVQPNPSSGDIAITCDYDIGDVTITVYDMLGTERASVPATITRSSPAHLYLPEAAGVYYFRVISQAGIDGMNVVVSR